MLNRINNRKAQAVVNEYAVLIFVVIASIVAMTVFFKRAVQSRIRASRKYLVSYVREGTREGTEVYYSGNLYHEYEPYYTQTDMEVKRQSSSDEVIKSRVGSTSGAYRKDIDETTTVKVFSETLPPKEYNVTTPY